MLDETGSKDAFYLQYLKSMGDYNSRRSNLQTNPSHIALIIIMNLILRANDACIIEDPLSDSATKPLISSVYVT